MNPHPEQSPSRDITSQLKRGALGGLRELVDERLGIAGSLVTVSTASNISVKQDRITGNYEIALDSPMERHQVIIGATDVAATPIQGPLERVCSRVVFPDNTADQADNFLDDCGIGGMSYRAPQPPTQRPSPTESQTSSNDDWASLGLQDPFRE